jgi:hypothetical protein
VKTGETQVTELEKKEPAPGSPAENQEKLNGLIF